ncbi:MAG: hypothetical protein WBM09_10695 [Gallionella sp.]
MEFWNNLESVKTLSHGLMLAALFLAIGAALSTGLRFYVDRRATELSSARQQADLAKRENAQHEREVSLKAQVEEAERAASEARRKAADIEALQAPRHLSNEQKMNLKKFLSDKPKGRIVIKASVAAPDAFTYGKEIATVLQDQAGWTVQVDNAFISGSDAKGMWFTVRDAQGYPQSLDIISSAFSHAGIPMSDSPNRLDPAGPAVGEVWLSIGTKF